MKPIDNSNPFTILLTTIPGPDRKRAPAIYQYRMIYRNQAAEPGCRMLWEVTGGRMAYQVAVERTEQGKLQWHCTCADAVYRGEKTANHRCKHVHGVLNCMPAEQSS